MRAPLTIAAAQPSCISRDVLSNARQHARTIRKAEARVVVFPELSLTGYELDAEPVSPANGALTAIVEACAETGTIALVGAPVVSDAGRAHIGTLRLSSEGADVVYRKSYLGGDEPTRFSPGDGAVAIDVGGRRIGLGICKDTGVEQHIAGTAALDVDLYVAGLVHIPEERDIHEQRGIKIARACKAYVAFASYAGPTEGGYEQTLGLSTIWSADGSPIARAGAAPDGMARASLA